MSRASMYHHWLVFLFVLFVVGVAILYFTEIIFPENIVEQLVGAEQPMDAGADHTQHGGSGSGPDPAQINRQL